MTGTEIYEDIARRTGGDIYIGVVGPVRTGKSTFISRFMETAVLPRMKDENRRERARDELPQSGAGRTIMTAEPKFVPEEAVELSFGAGRLRVRLIDCVGYLADGVLGVSEQGHPRMVTTPWFDHEVPIGEAAEFGTRKVMREHATVGLCITTDGTVTELSRGDYEEAEARILKEMTEIGKPFAVVVNSADPTGPAAAEVCEHIRRLCGAEPIPVNCAEMSPEKAEEILACLLSSFPLTRVDVCLPDFFCGLGQEHPVRTALYAALLEGANSVLHMKDAEGLISPLSGLPQVENARVASMDMGCGTVTVCIDLSRALFYQILSEYAGCPIHSEGELPALLAEFSRAKREYDRYEAALKQAYDTGYGIVMPTLSEMKLWEPEIVRQGGRSGVRLRAEAPSLHLIRADICTEVSPVVGSEKQSEELLSSLLSEFEGDTARIWSSDIFGKSLSELVNEGLAGKLTHMPAASQEKLREALERIINEGSNGLICIIL